MVAQVYRKIRHDKVNPGGIYGAHRDINIETYRVSLQWVCSGKPDSIEKGCIDRNNVLSRFPMQTF